MRYYVYENGSVVEREVDSLPSEIEEIYSFARRKYVIDHDVVDWADDDTDWGSGYDYDNSYRVFREPGRSELVVCDGVLYGFRVHEGKVLVPGEVDSARDGCIRERFGSMRTWKLIEGDPAPADHIFLRNVDASCADYEFAPEDFPAGLVESVVGKTNIQDSRGWFDGRARVTLKLAAAAVADPDETLAAFAEFCPLLVKVR